MATQILLSTAHSCWAKGGYPKIRSTLFLPRARDSSSRPPARCGCRPPSPPSSVPQSRRRTSHWPDREVQPGGGGSAPPQPHPLRSADPAAPSIASLKLPVCTATCPAQQMRLPPPAHAQASPTIGHPPRDKKPASVWELHACLPPPTMTSQRPPPPYARAAHVRAVQRRPPERRQSVLGSTAVDNNKKWVFS